MLALTAGACAPHANVDLPGPLRDDLAVRAVDALEHDPTFRTEVTREPGWHPICVATVFGVSPPGADTVAKADTIFARADCAWLPPPGTTPGNLDELPGESVPIALRIGPPLTYQVPEDGEGYPDSIRRIFPKELQQAAFAGADPSARDRLRERLRRGSAPAPSPS